MDQEIPDTRKEPSPPPPPTEKPIDATAVVPEGQNSVATVNSSGSEPDDAAQDIVTEVRDLANGSKLDILARLIQSRTVEVRLQRQLDAKDVTMATAVAEKTRLQLELAYYHKLLAVLERGAQETKSMFATISQQHTDAVKMMEELDLKRTQFIKEEQLLKHELAHYKQKFLNVQNEMQECISRFESESQRFGQLQVQMEKMTKANEIWQKKLRDAETKLQSMVSAHSAQLNEMENLLAETAGKLKDTQCRLDSEKRTNAMLKENTDMVLQEKTKLSMELATAENRIAAMEMELERKLRAADLKWQALLSEEERKASEKLANADRSAQELCSEKEFLVAKLAQQKDITAEMEGKLGGMQAILEDRNNEVFSLHSKLNCELKRFEEAKQQYSEGSSEMREQLSNLLKQSNEKDAKISRLTEDLHNQANTLATFKAQLELKDNENKQLKEKVPNVDHYLKKIQQLETALSKTSKVAQLEVQQRRQNRASGDDKTAINPPNSGRVTEEITAQITSTPVELSSSGGEELAANTKKARVMPDDKQKTHPATSPNYSNFQGSVHRKRTATSFFKRTASTEQVSISNTSFNRIIRDMDFDLSTASTYNMDDDADMSMAGSSIRAVKPFFRKMQDKK